jgi:hypothetical protein
MNKMITQIKDGGPAFPHAQRLWDNDAQSWAVHSVGGMTLRDYFAGQALSGILSKAINPNNQGNDSVDWASTRAPGPNRASGDAYEYADAMLAARLEGKQ